MRALPHSAPNHTIIDIWQGLRSRPDRTALSFLTVSVGVALLTILLLVVAGLRAKARNLVREFGANVFAVIAEGVNQGMQTSYLTEKHLSVLRANLPDCLVTGVRRFETTALGKTLSVFATDSTLLNVRQWPLLEGRFFDCEDCRRGERYCVVAAGIAGQHNLHPGDVLTLNGMLFKIIGVVGTGAEPPGDREWFSALGTGDLAVFVPRTAVFGWPERDKSDATDKWDAILVKTASSDDMIRLVHLADRLLSSPDLQVKGVRLIEPRMLLKGLLRLEMAIAASLGSITLVSLLLAGLTLSVLSVANVRERVVEIGLRRALGATPRDVATLFLLEACSVTGTAATIASAGIHMLVLLMRPKLSVPVQVNFGTFVIPLVLAVFLATLSALGPARAASRISPAEALRAE